jgi:hypothetical protein
MKKLVPKEKMSKITRRALDEKRRQLWTVPPLTRKIESKKHYQRKQKADDA